MTSHVALRAAPIAADPARQVSQLRHVLGLVEEIAGRIPSISDFREARDEGARLEGAYACAIPVVQRRFETLAAETAAWAAAGVEALLAAQTPGASPSAAAARLGDEIGKALRDLTAVLDS